VTKANDTILFPLQPIHNHWTEDDLEFNFDVKLKNEQEIFQKSLKWIPIAVKLKTKYMDENKWRNN
jgi:hypothetical protein